MSAANASAAPSQSIEDEMRAHEPSMEEILASIRRIIADDQALPASPHEREERRARGHDAADGPAPQRAYATPALEPTVDAENESPAVVGVHQFRPRASQEAATIGDEFEEAARAGEANEDEPGQPEFPAALVASDEEPGVAANLPEDALLSSHAASSVTSHFQALAASMVINDSGILQKYAQEMMRPMLKQWLDDNLPVIVERLVRAEIERVARGGRR
jgi:uncharacterized protein